MSNATGTTAATAAAVECAATSSSRAWFLSSSRLDWFTRKIDKIRSRAVAKGFTGDLVVNATPKTRTITLDGMRITEHGFRVTLSGRPACYEGWIFLGAVDFLDDQLVVRLAPGLSEDGIDRSSIRRGACDHCHNRRRRTHVLLVRHQTTGEVRQLGTTCVADFLGWDTTPSFVWPRDLEDGLEIPADQGEYGWTMREVMALSLAVVSLYGWTPKSAAAEDCTPTAELVRTILTGSDAYASQLSADVAPAMVDTQATVEQMRQALLADMGEATSGYAANLAALLRSDMVPAHLLGLAVSSVAAYHRLVADEAERAARAQARAERMASQWIGSEGDKVEVDAIVTGRRYLPGDYTRSGSWLISMRSEGNALKTFTAAKWAATVGVGDQIRLRATIKRLEDFQGERQTLLGRPKLVAA